MHTKLSPAYANTFMELSTTQKRFLPISNLSTTVNMTPHFVSNESDIYTQHQDIALTEIVPCPQKLATYQNEYLQLILQDILLINFVNSCKQYCIEKM